MNCTLFGRVSTPGWLLMQYIWICPFMMYTYEINRLLLSSVLLLQQNLFLAFIAWIASVTNCIVISWNCFELYSLLLTDLSLCNLYFCAFTVRMSSVCLIAVKVDHYCTQYQPSPPTCSAAGVVSIGRSTLQRSPSPQPSLQRQPTSRFAFTRPATALLERIAVAVGSNEPLLLVGETGTGKTAAVQYLAELMCKHFLLPLCCFWLM